MRYHRLVVLLISLAVLPIQSFAQIYNPLSSGSELICGYLPNGTNKIFKKQGKHYSLISKKVAAKQIATRRSGLTAHLQNLRELQRNFETTAADTVLTAQQVKSLVSITKFLIKGDKPDLGTSRDQQLQNIQQLIDGYSAAQTSVQYELDALNACIKNERAIYGEVTTTFIYFASAARTLVLVDDDVYKPLVGKKYTVPPLQSWCMDVKGYGGYIGKRAVVVSQDPCAVDQYNGSSVGTLNCPELVPKGKMGAFTGPLYGFQGGATQDAINNALDKLRTETPATYRGRLRAPSADSQEEVYQDDCSTI